MRGSYMHCGRYLYLNALQWKVPVFHREALVAQKEALVPQKEELVPQKETLVPHKEAHIPKRGTWSTNASKKGISRLINQICASLNVLCLASWMPGCDTFRHPGCD